MPLSHAVRHAKGGTIVIEKYTRSKAIRVFCSECLGWDEDPKKCTDPLCPLFPFRRKIWITSRDIPHEGSQTHASKLEETLESTI